MRTLSSLLVALVSLALAAPAVAERCKEDTLPGSWISLRSGNVWTFHPDGALSCEGPCKFVRVTGDPVSWAYEPAANVWSRPIEHVKLEFTKAKFEGIYGSFRCFIDNGGQTLRLVPEEDEPMVFLRK